MIVKAIVAESIVPSAEERDIVATRRMPFMIRAKTGTDNNNTRFSLSLLRPCLIRFAKIPAKAATISAAKAMPLTSRSIMAGSS